MRRLPEGIICGGRSGSVGKNDGQGGIVSQGNVTRDNEYLAETGGGAVGAKQPGISAVAQIQTISDLQLARRVSRHHAPQNRHRAADGSGPGENSAGAYQDWPGASRAAGADGIADEQCPGQIGGGTG